MIVEKLIAPGFQKRSLQKQDNLHQSEILRFIVTPFSASKVVFSTGNLIRQHYYYNYSCPGYIFMREEYGLLPRSCSFLTYIFEANGHDLMVISCTEHNRYEVTGFNSDYPYIRMPEELDGLVNWNYQLSDDIHVSCQSSFILNDEKYRTLQVNRKTTYTDGKTQAIDKTVEYYVAGVGMYSIEFSHGLKE